jgi:peptide/nickel transport system substrate-binding protein
MTEQRPEDPRLTRRRLLVGGGAAVGLALAPTVPLEAVARTLATSAPKRGGTLQLTISDGASTDSLDPALQTNNVGLTGLFMIYDNLLDIDPNWNLSPMLAEDYSHNKNGTIWTFKLRKGVTFHSGKPFTSADVAAHMTRILNPKTGSGGQSMLGASLAKTGIRASDPTTIAFHLTQPDAFFGVKMSHYYTRIPEAGVKNWTAGSPGTGPFMVKSYKPGEGFEYVRNPHYWMSGKPYLDGITCAVIAEQSTRVEDILSGDIDVSDPPSFSSVSTVQQSSNAALFKVPGGQPFLYDIDSNHVPYRDVRVKHALKMLVNRQEAMNVVVLGHGLTCADSFVSPTDPFYPHGLKPFPYDPEQAKSLLKQAGYGNGFSDKIWTTTAYPYLNEASAYLKQAFAAGNVNIAIESVSINRYNQAFVHEPIVADYALRQHPALYFALFYQSKSPVNTTRLRSAKVDSLIKQFSATLDPAGQKRVAGDIITTYNDIAAEIVPFQFDTLWMYKKRVKGMISNPMSNIDFRGVYLT